MLSSQFLPYIPSFLFFFNDTATTEIYTLSLHDALPIFGRRARGSLKLCIHSANWPDAIARLSKPDRKSTRLNSSHLGISYAVFCLKKKKRPQRAGSTTRQSSGQHRVLVTATEWRSRPPA